MSVPREVVKALYAELGPVLLAYARSIAGGQAEAEDALQHVFLKLMSDGAVLPREPRPYLFRAVRNTCLNRRRSLARETPHADAASFTAPDGRDELVRDLEQALRALPVEQREVVMLRVWGEMTLEEVSAVLDVPANTAASRYRYALDKLRRFFGAHLSK